MADKKKILVYGGIALGAIGITLLIRSLLKKSSKLTTDMIWDKISEDRIKLLHPKVQDKAREFINAAEKQGIKLRVTSTYRSYEEQNALYAKVPKVTNAKGGESAHNFRLALDVVPIENGQANFNSKDWNKIGQIGKSLGFEWGGDWHSIIDKPHFQMLFGNTLAQLRQKHDSGQMQNGNVIV